MCTLDSSSSYWYDSNAEADASYEPAGGLAGRWDGGLTKEGDIGSPVRPLFRDFENESNEVPRPYIDGGRWEAGEACFVCWPRRILASRSENRRRWVP